MHAVLCFNQKALTVVYILASQLMSGWRRQPSGRAHIACLPAPLDTAFPIEFLANRPAALAEPNVEQFLL